MVDTGTAKKVFRPTMDVNSVPIEKVKVGIPVNPAKKLDVKSLLRLHFGNDWEEKPELCFYKQILNDDQIMPEYSVNEEEGGTWKKLMMFVEDKQI